MIRAWLEEADTAVRFQAPEKIRALHPEFPAAENRTQLHEAFTKTRV